MEKIYIVGAARTPMGAFLGQLNKLSGVELAQVAVKAALERANVDPKNVDTINGGIVIKDGMRGNPARQVAYGVGIPMESSASTVEQQCASGLRALDISIMEMKCKGYGIGVAFGAESMSNAPNLILNAKKGSVNYGGMKLGPLKVVDSLIWETLHDAMLDEHHCVAAGRCADEFGISKDAQDEYTYRSHQLAKQSIANGVFKDEIAPVSITDKKGNVTVIDTDEIKFPNLTLERIKSFKSVFPDSGSCTAVNSCDLHDGASAVVVATESKVKELGLTPMAEVVDIVTRGLDPARTPVGPVAALPKLFEETNIKPEEIDIWEINEAFALVPLVVMKEFNVPEEKMNKIGGALAIGHPFGSSALRIFVTLLYEMKREGAKYGCGSMCVGGGVAMAGLLKNVSKE